MFAFNILILLKYFVVSGAEPCHNSARSIYQPNNGAASMMRALMALAIDLADYQALGERIRIQFEALATVHGVEIPEPAVAI